MFQDLTLARKIYKFQTVRYVAFSYVPSSVIIMFISHFLFFQRHTYILTFINGSLIVTCFFPDLTDDRGVHLVMSQLLTELDSVVNLLMRCFPSELLRRDDS